MKADNGFQDNYSVVVASGTWITDCPPFSPPPSQTCPQQHPQPAGTRFYLYTHSLLSHTSAFYCHHSCVTRIKDGRQITTAESILRLCLFNVSLMA